MSTQFLGGGAYSEKSFWILIAFIDCKHMPSFNAPLCVHLTVPLPVSLSVWVIRSLCISVSHLCKPLWCSKNPLCESARLVYHGCEGMSSYF